MRAYVKPMSIQPVAASLLVLGFASCNTRPPLAPAGSEAVKLTTEFAGACGDEFGDKFWLPQSSLAALGIGSKTCSSKCGAIRFGLSGNASADGVYNLGQIKIHGSDGCGVCSGCTVALMTLDAGATLPKNYRPGVTVSITYSRTPALHPKPGPDLPPPPPPPPPPLHSAPALVAICEYTRAVAVGVAPQVGVLLP
eukprot:SAG22_NODE_4148_length_1368_cov_0.917258_1_plen_195_part_10